MSQPLPLHVSTHALEAPDAAAALEALHRLDIGLAAIAPGRPLGDEWPALSRRWEGRLLLRGAFMYGEDLPRWNLSARDEDLRGKAVIAATEALRVAADLGATMYAVPAGWCLELTRDERGQAFGLPITPMRARDQLCRSLDRLAAMAESLGLGLLAEVEADLPRSGVVLGDPEGIVAVLARVDAGPLGLYVDLPKVLATARRHGEEPEVVLDLFSKHIRAIGLHAGAGKPLAEKDVAWELAKRLGGLALPVELALKDVEGSRLRDQVAMALELLAPAAPPVQEPIPHSP